MGRPPAADLLAVAEEAARAAGELLLPRFGRERVLATKSTPTDVVSEADLAAEGAIRDALARHRPDDGILGEEATGDIPGTSGLRWIVDPIDGTVNYLYGHPQWCVSVAVCEGDDAPLDGSSSIAGVVFDPVRGELFSAVRGGAAACNGTPLVASTVASLEGTLLATGFGYDAEQRAGQGELAGRLVAQVRDLRRAGSAALDLAWTAAGRLDAYYEHGTKAWDVAAGALLCTTAGLEVHALRDRPGMPAGTLAAPAGVARELLALVDAPG